MLAKTLATLLREMLRRISADTKVPGCGRLNYAFEQYLEEQLEDFLCYYKIAIWG